MLRSPKAVLSLLLALGAAGPLLAQPAAAQDPPPRGLTREEAGDLRETVHLLMLSRLKRELQLSEEQERQVLPLLDELEQARQEFRSASRRGLADLRRMLASGSASERELGDAVERARELRRGFESERQRIEQEVGRALTPEQQARLLVFMHDFRQRLRERLEGARRARPGRPGPRPRRPAQAPPGEGWEEEDL